MIKRSSPLLSAGAGNDVANYDRERRKMFIAVKDPRRAWTRKFW